MINFIKWVTIQFLFIMVTLAAVYAKADVWQAPTSSFTSSHTYAQLRTSPEAVDGDYWLLTYQSGFGAADAYLYYTIPADTYNIYVRTKVTSSTINLQVEIDSAIIGTVAITQTDYDTNVDKWFVVNGEVYGYKLVGSYVSTGNLDYLEFSNQTASTTKNLHVDDILIATTDEGFDTESEAIAQANGADSIEWIFFRVYSNQQGYGLKFQITIKQADSHTKGRTYAFNESGESNISNNTASDGIPLTDAQELEALQALLKVGDRKGGYEENQGGAHETADGYKIVWGSDAPSPPVGPRAEEHTAALILYALTQSQDADVHDRIAKATAFAATVYKSYDSMLRHNGHFITLSWAMHYYFSDASYILASIETNRYQHIVRAPTIDHEILKTLSLISAYSPNLASLLMNLSLTGPGGGTTDALPGDLVDVPGVNPGSSDVNLEFDNDVNAPIAAPAIYWPDGLPESRNNLPSCLFCDTNHNHIVHEYGDGQTVYDVNFGSFPPEFCLCNHHPENAAYGDPNPDPDPDPEPDPTGNESGTGGNPDNLPECECTGMTYVQTNSYFSEHHPYELFANGPLEVDSTPHYRITDCEHYPTGAELMWGLEVGVRWYINGLVDTDEDGEADCYDPGNDEEGGDDECEGESKEICECVKESMQAIEDAIEAANDYGEAPLASVRSGRLAPDPLYANFEYEFDGMEEHEKLTEISTFEPPELEQNPITQEVTFKLGDFKNYGTYTISADTENAVFGGSFDWLRLLIRNTLIVLMDYMFIRHIWQMLFGA